MVVHIDWALLVVILVVLFGLAIGIPAFLRVRNADDEREDEAATCEPIIAAYRKSRSVEQLLADYDAWKLGEHSSYTRVHFAAEVIDELRDAKRYEEALVVLEDLGNTDMKARDRYDYDNYRAACEPELREGIVTEEKRAAERARNKNLRTRKG